MENLNTTFEGLKDEVLRLNELFGREKSYQDFHGYLALLTPEKVIHAYGSDYDEDRIRYILNGGKPSQYWNKDKEGLSLTFEIQQIPVEGVGLSPVDGIERSSCCGIGGYYQDEMSNVEGYTPSRAILGRNGCGCAICRLKNKPKEIWQPLDFKISEEAIVCIKEYLESGDTKPKKVEFKRTPEEYKALEAAMEEYRAKKSFDLTDEIRKSASELPKPNERVEMLKSLKEKADAVMQKQEMEKLDKSLFREDVTLFPLKNNIDKEVETVSKSVKGNSDCVDFFK